MATDLDLTRFEALSFDCYGTLIDWEAGMAAVLAPWSVWINRRHDRPGWGATPEPSEEWTFDLEFKSMADFADAVDRAFTAV